MSDCAVAGNKDPTSTQQPHDVIQITEIESTEERLQKVSGDDTKTEEVAAEIAENPASNGSSRNSLTTPEESEPTTLVAGLEQSPEPPQQQQQQPNLNSSITSMNSGNGGRGSRGFSAFPPIRFTRSIQNTNWRENLSNNLTSVIQEFRPVFQSHNPNNRGIIANLSNYRIPSNSSFRYIDSPASETNPPNYASDSFVINFDNPPPGYRSTARPSLTDSLRLEHTHDPHASARSDGGGGGGGDDEHRDHEGPTTPPPPPAQPVREHEHNENNNLTDTIAQIPEAASLLDTLSRYVPYVCILLAKSCYDHLDGILDFFALFVTFYHTNRVVRQEVTKQNQRSLLNLLRALFFIAVVVAVIGFMLDKKNIPLTMLITGSLAEPFTLKSLMFAIGVNDLILKLFTVAVKIVITLMPPSFVDYKGRGRIYLMTEAISQFLRSLVTTHPWLIFLLDSYQGTEKIMGIILSGAYIVAKGSDLLQRIKFCKQAFIKLLQKVSIGVIPTKEQIQQAGGICTICHDNFNTPAMLDCGHIYCELCISTWLDRAQLCPLCRAKISDDPSFRDGSTTFFIQLY